MKDRVTLGHIADAGETAALTMVDPRATERIIEACDYVEERTLAEKAIDLTDEQCRNAAVERVRRALGNKCAEVIRAYLNHKDWKNINIPRTTFQHALKKVENYFQPHKIRVK
jgi:CHASE3 domain sensor protein